MTTILRANDSTFLRTATGTRFARPADGDDALKMARGKKPHVIRFGRLLSKMTELDGLKALNNDPATAAIAGMAFTGLSQKNALRLEPDRACAFLEKAEPGAGQGV